MQLTNKDFLRIWLCLWMKYIYSAGCVYSMFWTCIKHTLSKVCACRFWFVFQLFGRGKTFSPFPGFFETLSEISQHKLNVTHLLPRAVGFLISRQRIARPKRNRQNESYFLGGRDTVDCALVDLHSQFQELKDFCWASYLVVGFSFQGSLWVLFGCGTFVCFFG